MKEVFDTGPNLLDAGSCVDVRLVKFSTEDGHQIGQRTSA